VPLIPGGGGKREWCEIILNKKEGYPRAALLSRGIGRPRVLYRNVKNKRSSSRGEKRGGLRTRLDVAMNEVKST